MLCHALCTCTQIKTHFMLHAPIKAKTEHKLIVLLLVLHSHLTLVFNLNSILSHLRMYNVTRTAYLACKVFPLDLVIHGHIKEKQQHQHHHHNHNNFDQFTSNGISFGKFHKLINYFKCDLLNYYLK